MEPFDVLKMIISEEMDIDPEEIKPEASFKEDLEMDQISFLQVLMALEVEFDLELDPTDIEQIKTVGDALAYISEDY